MVLNYRIFISHSWTYGDKYDRLISMLNERPYFYFTDYSVPKNDPIHNANNDTQLSNAIKNQMQSCNIVLIMGGVYATYSKWIDKEITIAKRVFDKPLLGICPWGAEKISKTVRDNADELVRWNTESIVDAIRKWAI